MHGSRSPSAQLQTCAALVSHDWTPSSQPMQSNGQKSTRRVMIAMKECRNMIDSGSLQFEEFSIKYRFKLHFAARSISAIAAGLKQSSCNQNPVTHNGRARSKRNEIGTTRECRSLRRSHRDVPRRPTASRTKRDYRCPDRSQAVGNDIQHLEQEPDSAAQQRLVGDGGPKFGK